MEAVTTNSHAISALSQKAAAGRCIFDQYVICGTTILFAAMLLVAPKPSDTPPLPPQKKILHIDVVAMCSGAT